MRSTFNSPDTAAATVLKDGTGAQPTVSSTSKETKKKMATFGRRMLRSVDYTLQTMIMSYTGKVNQVFSIKRSDFDLFYYLTSLSIA